MIIFAIFTIIKYNLTRNKSIFILIVMKSVCEIVI